MPCSVSWLFLRRHGSLRDAGEPARWFGYVSCQAEGHSPFNSPQGGSLFAQAAVQGDVIAIRSEGLAKTQQILADVTVPVIGLLKDYFADGSVCISRDPTGVAALVELGCALVAIDGTPRLTNGLTGPALIAQIKQRFPRTELSWPIWPCLVMRRLASLPGLTVSQQPYTPATQHRRRDQPDIALVQALCATYPTTLIIAEGRINAPQWLPPLQTAGAWAVAVGSAFTRPVQLTQSYFAALG